MVKLLDIVSESCLSSPESICCIAEDPSKGSDYGVLSYSSMWRCLEQHESWLRTAIGSFTENQANSDIVFAYLSSNSIDMLLSLLACTSSMSQDRTPALLNFRWTAMEMASALQSKGQHATTILLYGTGFEMIAKKASSLLNHKACCLPIPNFSAHYLQKHYPSSTVQRKAPRFDSLKIIDQLSTSGSDRDALIIFTSGTTGGSKGVRLSHRAIAIQSLAKISHPCEYSTETTMLASTVPLFHVGGLSSCLAVIFSGGALFFPHSTSVGFDSNSVQRSLLHPRIPVNTLVVVPAMLVSILSDKTSPEEYPKVRLLLIGGQSAPTTMIEKLKKKFPNARIVQTYACTEAASSLTFLRIKPTLSNSVASRNENELSGDCVGSPPRHVEIRLYKKSGKATKIVTQPNHVGVIATRGPHIMNGYWSRGEEERNLNGWLITSDLGYWSLDGQLCFRGRIKDVIRSGGETILANEVERIIQRHADILECAVFPRQDERFGEAVACAIVVERPLQLGAIRSWCGEYGLAGYKRPRYLFLVDALPRNSSGKILKHKLVATYGKISNSKL